jgi:CheY-like chemotaxis protein
MTVRACAVDDNRSNRMVLARVLRGICPMTIVEKEDGTEVRLQLPCDATGGPSLGPCGLAARSVCGGGSRRSIVARRPWSTSSKAKPRPTSSSWTGERAAVRAVERSDAPLRCRRMTTMNGDEATAILRASGVTTPIVGLTGDAHHEDLETFRQRGATEVRAAALPAECVPADAAGRSSPSRCRARCLSSWWTSICVCPRRHLGSVRVTPHK